MEQDKKKTLNHYMRILHRDIGFFIIGFIIIYSLSGVVLIYRNTDLLKHDVSVEVELSPGIDPGQLGNALRIKDLKLIDIKGDFVYFQNGSYNNSTGIAKYTVREVIPPLNKFIKLHKSASNNPVHWINITFGILLLFLAISSLWMYKRGTSIFRRSLYLGGTGIIAAILLLFFL
jgi:hypothetical protein